MERRKCKKCGRTKPLTDFYERVTSRGGYMWICKDCCRRKPSKAKKNTKRSGLTVCKHCCKTIEGARYNQKFCNEECREAYWNEPVKTACSICGKEYEVARKTVRQRKLNGVKPICYSCSATKSVYSGLSDTPHHWRECHTPGCHNRTTNYWCDKCHERRAKGVVDGPDFDDFGGQVPFPKM